jgi:hypothetical protein
MSTGVTICALMWCCLGLVPGTATLQLQQRDADALAVLYIGFLLLTLHVVISNLMVGGVDFPRFFISIVLLFIALAGARFAARRLENVPQKHLIQMANFALIFLTVIGFASLVGVPPIGPQHTSKPVVIFSEPSHFSLAYLPMLLFRVSTASRRKQLQLLAVATILAISLQSLTMIAGILIIAALLLRTLPLLAFGIPLALASVAVDITYYSDRLTLSADSDNLSTLVFLQGWDNAIVNFNETHGFGIGFQQFGVAGSTGDIGDTIVALLGDSLSLRDGGSTATKLIGEFGVFGIVLLILFIRSAYRSAIFIRNNQRKPAQHRDIRRLFFGSLVVAYIIELFIRGTGYFSPGGFLVAVAFMSTRRLAAASLTDPTGIQTVKD